MAKRKRSPKRKAEAKEKKRALVVAAHPDDAEFGCGGTAALWSKNGWEFYYLICTDGSKGSDDPQMSTAELIPLRRQEQKAAASLLGVLDTFFLDFVDGELAYDAAFMREVVRYIRKIKPFAVFSHDPNQIIRNEFINHPDHRCAGTVALDAVYPIARNRPSFPELIAEGLEPHRTQEVYLWLASEPNYEVDISSVSEIKFKALMEHKSQFANMTEETIAGWRQRLAEPDGRYLERFRRVELIF